MTYRIGKQFHFEAAHRLEELPEGHKCRRHHGHSYTVAVTLVATELVEPGFVTDFGDLKPFAAYLDAALDHQNLNEVLPFAPTSEALARHLAEWFIAHVQPGLTGRLESVRVSETASTWAEFVPSAGAAS